MTDNDPQYKTEDGSALRIWRDTAKNNFHSEKAGRPVFDEVIYVEVISPGSPSSIPVFEVKRFFCKEADMEPKKSSKYEQFARFIEAFEAGDNSDQSLSGTPLKEWAEISRSMAASLQASQIYTVDALANLPDTALIKVGPDGRTWREKAKAYLETAKNSGYATALAADVQNLRDQLEARTTELLAMATRVQELEAAQSGASPLPNVLASAAQPQPIDTASAAKVEKAPTKPAKLEPIV